MKNPPQHRIAAAGNGIVGTVLLTVCTYDLALFLIQRLSQHVLVLCKYCSLYVFFLMPKLFGRDPRFLSFGYMTSFGRLTQMATHGNACFV